MEDPLASPLRLAPTRLVQSRILGPRLGLGHLYFKVESHHPTRTFKDREALVAVSRFCELGIERLVTASTGDSGAAYLRAALLVGLDLTVFVPRNAAQRWHEIVAEVISVAPSSRGTHRTVIAGETFDEAIGAAERNAEEHGIPLEYGFGNQLRVEGVKTLAFEVLETLGRVPDAYVQAVGSGVGLYAFWKGAREWGGHSPALYGVQPFGCNPTVRAYDGNGIPVGQPRTHVVGIANPTLPASWGQLRSIGCRFLSGFPPGKENELDAALRLREEMRAEGIEDAGLEAACALSGLETLRSKGLLRPTDRIVVAVSGGLRGADLLGEA